MAQSDLDIIVGADTRNLNRNVNTAVRKLERKGVNLDTKKGQMALGRITGKADEFTKSLEASNARVIAFGASVAVIEGVRRSFTKLVSTIVEVEQQLTAINSILGQSSGTITKFGNELFEVAKKTGQSFQQVAQTAQEFARQGLSVEQTLQRTSDALILTRLTTLKTDEAVAALTATINGFQREALTSTQVINKLRAVETSFAVSSDDLASALARSASVAQGAGVSFNELLGVITAIKQRTGLGGATIGQGLKTVFTRLNLPSRVAQLKELGVEIDASANGFEKLRQVSIAYKAAQNANNQGLATQIGVVAAGQFQISKLSAAFDDLANSYSISDSAARKSLEATDEANRANEAYNQTIAGISKQIVNNIGKIFSSVGELGTGDAIKDIVTNINSILEAFQGNKLSGSNAFISLLNDTIIGAKNFGFLRDAAEGFAKVLTGPGLVAAAAVIKNLFSNTLMQGGASLLSLTGVNKGQKNREQNQAATVSLLKQGTIEEQKQFALATSQAQKEQVILGILQKQLAIQKAQEMQEIRTAEALRKKGLVITAGAGGYTTRRSTGAVLKGLGATSMASGTIPEAIIREQNAINRNVGGATSKAQARVIEKFNYGRGKKGPAVVNSEELIIPNKSGDIVLNKEMMKGGMMNKSTFNYAAGSKREIAIKGKLENGLPLTAKDKEWLRKNAGTNPGGASSRNQNKILPATASAIIKRGGNSIYADNTIGSVRTNRFKERSQGVNPVGRPTAKEAIKRNLINKGASGAFENLRSSGGGFSKFNRRLDSLDRADVINENNKKQKIRNQKAQELREKRRQREQAAIRQDIEKDIKIGDRSRQFSGEDPLNPNTRFSPKDRAEIQAEEYNKEIRSQRERRGMTQKDLDSTPDGKKLKQQVRASVRASVGNRFFKIDQAIAEQQVEGAQSAIDKQSRKGFGRFGMPSFRGIEKRFDNDKTLTPMAKQMLKGDIANRRFQRNQGIAQKGFLGSFALSASAPMIGRGVTGLTGDEKKGNIASGAAQGAATGLAAGALFGPKGAAIGLLGGAAFGGFSAAMDKGPSETEKLVAAFEKTKEKNVNINNAVSGFLQSQSLISDLLSSGDFDEKKILNVQDSARSNLTKSGLGREDIRELTNAKQADRGGVAARIQNRLNAQTNMAESRIELAKIFEEQSTSKSVMTDQAKNFKSPSLFKNIQNDMFVAFDQMRADFGGDSNQSFDKVTKDFSKIRLPSPSGDTGDKAFQETQKIILDSIDFATLDKSVQESGGNLDNFSTNLRKSFRTGDVAEIEKSLAKLGIKFKDMPPQISEATGQLNGFGTLLSAIFNKGGQFGEQQQSRTVQRASIKVQANDARFGQAQLSVLDAQRSTSNVNAFRARLSSGTELNRRGSALAIGNARFGIKDSEKDENFTKLQGIKVEQEKLKTGANRDKIFDGAGDDIRKIIEDPMKAGSSEDNEQLSLTLAKLGDGISSLQELKDIKDELQSIFTSSEKLGPELNALFLKTAELVQLETDANKDRLTNIEISNDQASILRDMSKNASVRSQIENETGISFGPDDQSIPSLVKNKSELVNTEKVRETLQKQAVDFREGFVTAIGEKDEEGEFKISESEQRQMLASFDRNIKETGRPGSGISKSDIAGRTLSALNTMEGGKFSKNLESLNGLDVLKSEVGSRGKALDETIATMPQSVKERFTRIEQTTPDRDAGLSSLVNPQSEEDAKNRENIIQATISKQTKERELIRKKMEIGVDPRFETEFGIDSFTGGITAKQVMTDFGRATSGPSQEVKDMAKKATTPQVGDNSSDFMGRYMGNGSAFNNTSKHPKLANTNHASSLFGRSNPHIGYIPELDPTSPEYKPPTSIAPPMVNKRGAGQPPVLGGEDFISEELRSRQNKVSEQGSEKSQNDFLKTNLEEIKEALSNTGDGDIADELKSAITALNAYLESGGAQEDKKALGESIEEIKQSNEPLDPLTSMESIKDLSNAIRELKESKGGNNEESLGGVAASIDALNGSINDGIESTVQVTQNLVLSVDGETANFSDTKDLIAAVEARVNVLEASLRGDVTTPA
tara:strand:- start:179 stop:6328 length:6150 start_codon:yes stop_codon:yes gene_type:complete